MKEDRNHRIRFCDNNHLADPAAKITVSSEQVGFEFSKAVDSRRYNEWQPAGSFSIGPANNRLVVNSGNILDIPIGQYTGEGLAATIEAAVNAVNAVDWQVTYSASTYRFSFSTSAYQTINFSSPESAIWSTLGFYTTVIRDTANGPVVSDTSVVHTSEFFEVDFRCPRNCSFLALMPPVGLSSTLSGEGLIRVRASSAPNFDQSEIDLTFTATSWGGALFLDSEEDTTFRYWRVDIIDPRNPGGPKAFRFGQIYLGDAITFNRRNVQTGFSKSIVDSSVLSESAAGSIYARKRAQYLRFENCELVALPADERREIEDLFARVGVSEPLYVSLDPLQLVSNRTDELTRYCYFSEPPSLQHIKSDYYSLSFNLREAV